MTTSMQGRVVLIPGGNSGIGKETAVARAGATVVFTSRNPHKGERAAASGTPARPSSPRPVPEGSPCLTAYA